MRFLKNLLIMITGIIFWALALSLIVPQVWGPEKFLEVIKTVVFYLIIYSIPAIALTFIIIALSHRYEVFWLSREFLLIFIPLIFWSLLVGYGTMIFPPIFDAASGIVNPFLGPFYIGVIGGLILVPRLFIKAESQKEILFVDSISVVIACIIVTLIIIFTQPHPAP
jgi:hypothetical protein